MSGAALLESNTYFVALDTQKVSRRERPPPGARSRLGSSSEQQLQLRSSDLRQRALILAENCVCQVALRALQLENLFLDRVACHQAAGDHVPLLSDAVSAVDGLGLDGRIPPRVEEKHVLGGRQIEPMTASPQADEEELTLRVPLKALDDRLSVAGGAIEICVHDGLRVEPLPQQREKARELREHECFVSLRRGHGELGEQHVQLRARRLFASAADERRMARGLAQPK